jgi:hypothetical protein
MYRVKLYIYNISLTIKNLKRLRDAFEDKNVFIFNTEVLDKSNYYIGRINSKIKELESYQCSLEDNLERIEYNDKKYKTLFKKIPRYYELNEEIYLQLT